MAVGPRKLLFAPVPIFAPPLAARPTRLIVVRCTCQGLAAGGAGRCRARWRGGVRRASRAGGGVGGSGGGAGGARSLAGGNQQKLVAGREMSRDPVLLIAVQPTRGLDVGSIEYIHKRLTEQRDSGRGVLLVSLELDEILSLADRIAVISRGEIIGVEDTRNIDEQSVGLMMAGVTRGA